MIVFNSINDQNALSFIFNFPASKARLRNKSTYLIGELLYNECKGGMYSYLQEQGLIQKVTTDDFTSFRTIMHQYYIEFRLTDKGLREYRTVTQVLFGYIKFILSYLSNPSNHPNFYLFEEIKQMSQLSHKYFKVPDPLDNV